MLASEVSTDHTPAEANMDILSLGIDIAKTSFTAAGHGPAGEYQWGLFANNPAGFEQWRAQVQAVLDAHPDWAVLVVLEPTGGYELPLAGFAAQQGWPVKIGRAHV